MLHVRRDLIRVSPDDDYQSATGESLKLVGTGAGVQVNMRFTNVHHYAPCLIRAIDGGPV